MTEEHVMCILSASSLNKSSESEEDENDVSHTQQARQQSLDPAVAGSSQIQQQVCAPRLTGGRKKGK